MPQVRQSVIQQVFALLDNSYFAIPDFEVVFPEQGSTYVEIQFRHSPDYYFKISEELEDRSPLVAITENQKRVPRTRESPGNFKSSEVRTHASFDSAIARIPAWCANINKDLRARIPVFAEFDDLKRRLDEHLAGADSEADAYFTKAEVETLSGRLDAFAEKLTALEEQHKITKDQLDAAIADLDSIKANAREIPKGLWECLNFCVRGARRLVHGGGRRLRRTTDAVGKSVPHVMRLLS
jgi:hypothetical protein